MAEGFRASLNEDVFGRRIDGKTRRCSSSIGGISSWGEPPSKGRKIDSSLRKHVNDSYGAIFEMELMQVDGSFGGARQPAPCESVRSPITHKAQNEFCDGFPFTPPQTDDNLLEKCSSDSEPTPDNEEIQTPPDSWRWLSQRATPTLPVPIPQAQDLASAQHCIEAMYI